MINLTLKDLEKLKRLEQNATKGEWYLLSRTSPNKPNPAWLKVFLDSGGKNDLSDLALICEFRRYFPALIKVVQARLKELEGKQ